MGEDLNMTATSYSIVLLVFFISYVLFEAPSNMLLTRARPSVYLPALMFCWGGLSMCFAACKSWQAIAGLRFLLGVLEASFAPGVLFLLSSWYKKGELGRRYSLYYSAVAISGIFGGLIAGGLLKTLDGHSGLRGWRWLFIVEGAATCFVSLFAFFTLPNYPSTTMWLTPRERKIASQRLAMDSLGDAQSGEKQSHTGALKDALTDWRTWAFVLTYMATTGSQTIQYFIPSLVKVSVQSCR
jgi:MFS family permease